MRVTISCSPWPQPPGSCAVNWDDASASSIRPNSALSGMRVWPTGIASRVCSIRSIRPAPPKMSMMSDLEQAADLIRQAGRILAVTHLNPDPDAIGSLLGMDHILHALGKDVTLICDDPLPRSLAFLPGSQDVRQTIPESFAPQLIIGLDSSDVERLGTAIAPSLSGGIPVLNIDHHLTNTLYGGVNVVIDRASTAEILLPLADALGVGLSQKMATCILAGLIGDTRSFSTASVAPETFQAAARLIEAGADLADITERVFNRKTFNQLRLWGLALSHLALEDRVIWATIPRPDRVQLGLPDSGLNGLSNLLLSIAEANIAAVALSLGGGGHALAAGCKLAGSLDEAARRVVALLKVQTSQPVHDG